MLMKHKDTMLNQDLARHRPNPRILCTVELWMYDVCYLPTLRTTDGTAGLIIPLF